MHKPLVIAHRGDSSRALENSPDAMRRALSVPVDMVEVDIRMSSDEVLYVMHDRSTGRTADGNFDIERVSSETVSRVRLKNGEPIPTFEDVLALVAGRAGINFEIKSDKAGAVCAKRLFQYRYSGYVLFSSFKEAEVLSAREVMLDLPVSGIFDTFSPHHVPAYKAKGYPIISLRKTTVNERLVSACHEQGIKAYVWTVDDEEEMKRFIALGVDGIYTNKPEVLKGLVGK